MTECVLGEIEALKDMTVGRLRERYADVFAEPARSCNRQWLLRRVAWRIQANAEGDLPERARARARELARDADCRVRPPRAMPGQPLPRTATTRLSPPRDARLPLPGTVLTRSYKGIEHRVMVLPEGFEHDGKTYRSLSAVAHAISGSHWNGFLFFGLAKPSRAKEITA